ncbi:MAG: cell division protein ZipA [Gammaproteobacteria bacterium]
MNDLRLILVVIGVVAIGIIYFWETIKQRHLQRRRTVSQSTVTGNIRELKITPRLDADDDFSSAISDLNSFMPGSGRDKKTSINESISISIDGQGKTDSSTGPGMKNGDRRNLFSSRAGSGANVPDTERVDEPCEAVKQEEIITLHVTAPPIKTFNGRKILDAVNAVGMEYGDMNIFHHYGIGQMHLDRPLFSLADMFEPGVFDLHRIDSHNTRGLSLFLRLPLPVDGEVVFELMLNTAQRLADMLGGEVRAANHSLINDAHINAIRHNISHLTI